MKKYLLATLMIICGIMGGVNIFGTIVGLFTGLDVFLFYGVFAVLFIFANRKLAAKVKLMKNDGINIKGKIKEKKEAIKGKIKEKKEAKEKAAKEKINENPIAAKEKYERPDNDKLIEMIEEKQKEKKNKEKPKKDGDKAYKIAGILGTIFGYIICIGLVVGGIVLAFVAFKFILGLVWAVMTFIFNAILYVIGFIIFLVLAGGFLSLWWDGVKWEHVYKPRGYVKVKRRR